MSLVARISKLWRNNLTTDVRYVRPEFLKAISVKNSVFWQLMPCGLVDKYIGLHSLDNSKYRLIEQSSFWKLCSHRQEILLVLWILEFHSIFTASRYWTLC
jgi:hypothetical protein